MRAVATYSPEPKFIESFREIGFTAVNLVPTNGILRGESALVALGDAGPNRSILRADTAQCVAFSAGQVSGTDERLGAMPYPGSLMGVLAVLRQTLLDARHHAADLAHFRAHSTTRVRPAANLALDALHPVLEGHTVFFEPGSVLMLDRAHRIAAELGVTNRVLVASGHEWRRPDLAGATHGPFIVPVALPALPKFPDESGWEDVSLDQLRAWDWAAENPAVLRRTGSEIALTTHGLSERKDFRRNLRAALDRGLAENDALAALTIVPARLCGIDAQLGTIEPGRIANLTVVAGSYFEPDNPVRPIWVDGVPFELPRPASNQVARATGETNLTAATTNSASAKPAKAAELRELARKRVAREPLADRPMPPQPPRVLVKGATIWTCGPAGVLRGASLLVREGRIEAVGDPQEEAPAGVEVVDGTGLHITPGIIDCHSHSMVLGQVNEATLPSTAMVRIADVVNSETENIHRQLAGGVTMANLLHGSANPIGGQNCVIKLRDGGGPEDLKFTNAPAGIKFALGENVKQSNWGERVNTRFPQSRMGVQTFYVNRFTAAAQYRLARDAARNAGANGPPFRQDLELDALAEILDGTRLVHCHSYRQDEILTFLRTMESFGVRVATFQHVLEGYKVADELARHGAGASAFADWWAYKYEVVDAIPYAGSILRERGVTVSFNWDSSDHARRLNFEAAKAVKYGGTPPEEALKFVTLNPAKQLRVDRWVGSLELGKDADFAVWSGNPLDSSSVCLQTWIDGRKYFDRTQETARVKALGDERAGLLAKAKQFAAAGGDAGASDKARAKFFEGALERARHYGVSECQDCRLDSHDQP